MIDCNQRKEQEEMSMKATTVLLIAAAAVAAWMWLSAPADQDEEYTSAVPLSYQDQVSDVCGVQAESISTADTDGITSLSLNIEDGESLEFLKAFRDLDTLELTFSTDDDRECLDTVPYLPNLTNLTISADRNLEISFAANNGAFLHNGDNIEYLCLNGVDVGPGSVEQLHNLDTLVLMGSLNYEIDYASLDIGELDLSWCEPYDVPVFLTYEEYETLTDHGVEVSFDPEIGKNEYIGVWKEIEQIAGTLGVSKYDTEQQITDAVTAYTIDRLEYDPEISWQIRNDCLDDECVSAFYEGGALYGALAKDTAICGNYTALVKALSECFDVESFYLINSDHAWNLVWADGEPGHVDATFLDGENPDAANMIRNGEGDQLCWYMVDEESARGLEGREDPLDSPAYMSELDAMPEVEEAETEEEVGSEPEGLFESLLELGAELLGLLGALAAAIAFIKAVVSGFREEEPVEEEQKHAVLYWSRRKKKAVLGQKDCLIGSNRSAVNLCVDNRFISRQHAKIGWTQQGYFIQDMGSKNGTFINDRPVSNRIVLLQNGDVIRLGNEQFQFRYC